MTWSTFNDTQDSRVQYGEGYMDKEATGFSKLFVDGGRRKRRQYIHTVTLKDLKFDTSYGKLTFAALGQNDFFLCLYKAQLYYVCTYLVNQVSY